MQARLRYRTATAGEARKGGEGQQRRLAARNQEPGTRGLLTAGHTSLIDNHTTPRCELQKRHVHRQFHLCTDMRVLKSRPHHTSRRLLYVRHHLPAGEAEHGAPSCTSLVVEPCLGRPDALNGIHSLATEGPSHLHEQRRSA